MNVYISCLRKIIYGNIILYRKLRQQLQIYPEAVVAEQLGRVLLSRIVLLDSTAQVKLLPFIFKPKGEDIFIMIILLKSSLSLL